MRAITKNGFRLLLDYHRLPDPGDYVAEGLGVITTSERAAEHYRQAQQLGLVPMHREAFVVMLLNARHSPLAFHVCSVGTLNSAPVHPREVFRPAIACGAAAIIVAHHHPSGDPTPSGEDLSITERLTDAGALLGIQVLDHLVIGSERFYSFSDGRARPFQTPRP